jgi:hypothetical protein
VSYYSRMTEDRGELGRGLDRITVSQAAEALGISQDAIRKRISRGTIAHDRDERGRVLVYLDPSETVHKTDQDRGQDAASKTVRDAHVQSLEDQILFLRRELERKDAILLRMAERIPALEPAQDTRESLTLSAETPEAPTSRSATGGTHSDAEGPRGPPGRSWWRRWFG